MLTKDEFMALKEFFDSFDNVERISEIIILGMEGGIRRIVYSEDDLPHSTSEEIK